MSLPHRTTAGTAMTGKTGGEMAQEKKKTGRLCWRPTATREPTGGPNGPESGELKYCQQTHTAEESEGIGGGAVFPARLVAMAVRRCTYAGVKLERGEVRERGVKVKCIS